MGFTGPQGVVGRILNPDNLSTVQVVRCFLINHSTPALTQLGQVMDAGMHKMQWPTKLNKYFVIGEEQAVEALLSAVRTT